VDVSGVLKGFRQSSEYLKPKEKEDEKPEGGVRTFKLTDDEMKSLQSNPGEEVTLQVSGKVEDDGHFHVMSVTSSDGQNSDEKEMAAQIAPQIPGMG